jgi:hypothetical protein
VSIPAADRGRSGSAPSSAQAPRSQPADRSVRIGQRLKVKAHSDDFGHLGDGAIRIRNRAMLRRAELCVIVHRSPSDAGTKDLARQALAAGVSTYLIDVEQGVPRRLWAGDERLGWEAR